jgi:hypothetical protein
MPSRFFMFGLFCAMATFVAVVMLHAAVTVGTLEKEKVSFDFTHEGSFCECACTKDVFR